ncbi:MAG: tRNA guanosine(15) transglycosylase TgtA [Candidatus Thermoplasmatota archaeon]|nr:tRNA guanosine(15) transglycosylase TgtA [Candidatus Thermoplasmatota archaeon]
MNFEIKDRDAAGRICKFTTEHGTVTTPNLMPVINPNKMLISPKEMKKLFGTEIVITNSYIIKKDKKLREESLKNGVHKLIDFDGPIMTDSGTFQSYVYGDIKLDPIEIVEFQRNIGSDIGTILDIFGTPDQTKEEIKNSAKETLKRAKESTKVKGKMNLACTVQGSIYPDLREKCANDLSKTDADFFPIGGVVPLMENQRYCDLVNSIIYSKKGLDPSKPVHLFGCGHPLIFPLAVALGCDFFDSSAYAKYANDNRMIFYWGTEKLDNLSELPCSCPVCSKYTADELKKLSKKEKKLEIAKHNLYASFEEIKKIRSAISNGSLWELVERRANCNPHLLEAMNLLRSGDVKDFLEKFEPTSKSKALFYTGPQSIHRPIVHRCHNRLLDRYKETFDTTIVFPDGDKPYSTYYFDQIKGIRGKNCRTNILVDSALGPVPIELDEMYPFAQSVFPEITDKESEEEIARIFDRFTKGKKIICWDDKNTIDELKQSKKEGFNFDVIRISAVSDMQFGRNASKALFNGEIKIVKSKKTGKIRNIYCDGKHILSMRASDGLFTLKVDGGKLLHKYFKSPIMRVTTDKDAVPFVKDGKSVFAKFVKECDPELRPLDECLIVDEKDNLLAVGRCLLNRVEMLSFNYGMAVKTREHM